MFEDILLKDRLKTTDILRYAGYRGEDKPAAALLGACREEVLSASRPKIVFKESSLADAAPLLLGESIKCHLAGCSSCFVFAATLGTDVDKLLFKSRLGDAEKMLLLDAAASAAIEAVCDDWQEQIAAACFLEGKSTTARYSPGYGDMPISLQSALLAFLDAGRRIGLTATAGSLLTPMKSVTAVVGVKERGPEEDGAPDSCAVCDLRTNCLYNKR